MKYRSALAALMVCACMPVAACSDDEKPKPSPEHAGKDSGTPAKHGDAAVPRDSGAATDASVTHDAGMSDAGFEPVIVGQTDPLPNPRFAFKAGYAEQEQVWLIDAHGELRQVPTGEVSPILATTCNISGSSSAYGGYAEGSGRFSQLFFDPSGHYLVFRETLGCRPTWTDRRARVLAYEVSTGITREVLRLPRPPEIAGSRGGIVVYVDHLIEMYPKQPPDNPPPAVFAFEDGAFEPIDLPNALGVRASSLQPVYIAPLGDRALLLAGGVAPLERVGGKWQRSQLFDEMDDLQIGVLNSAASGDHVCGTAGRIDDGGRQIETLLWTIDASGKWRSISVGGDFRPYTCNFSPDGKRVAFGEIDHVFESATMKQIEPPSFAPVGLWWASGAALYGRPAAGDRRIVRIDWSTLEMTEIPELATLPLACSSMTSQLPQLVVAPDDRDLAIVKLDCSCEECDESGTLAWRPSTGALSMIEEPLAHDVFGLAWPNDGGAVLLSTQSGPTDDGGVQEPRPEPSSYFAIDAKGFVKTVGPLDGPKGAMHGPAVPPLR